MFTKKNRLTVTDEEKNIMIKALIYLKNDLINQGRYTDCVDELILKLYYN